MQLIFLLAECLFWLDRATRLCLNPRVCSESYPHLMLFKSIYIFSSAHRFSQTNSSSSTPKSLSMAISGKLELPKGYKTCVRRYSNCFWPCSIIAGAGKFGDSGTPSWNLCEGVESWGWRFGFKKTIETWGKWSHQTLRFNPWMKSELSEDVEYAKTTYGRCRQNDFLIWACKVHTEPWQ